MSTAHALHRAAPHRVAAGIGLACFVFAADLWIKLLGRAAGCHEADSIWTRVRELYAAGGCAGLDLLGPTVRLATWADPAAPWGAELAPGAARALGLVVLALATAVTLLVVRWRWRSSGDSLALGVLWGGALASAAPRLLTGRGCTELMIAGLRTGLADLAIAWALVWLTWRVIAEWRA